MEFNHGLELLQLCEATGLPISQVMKKREAEFSGISEEEVDKKMEKALEIITTKISVTNTKKIFFPFFFCCV